jgi:hypothetical protein
MPDERRFNLGYRPTTYWPTSQFASAYVAGTKRRELTADGHLPSDVRPELLREHLSETTRTAWGAIHPSFMGGEYLPERRDGQAVVARVELASVTGDVIELRAMRSSEGGIDYEVVDEYENEFDFSPRHSIEPLTLGQLIGLLDGVSHFGADAALGDGLTSFYRNLNFSEDPAGAESFVRVHSSFYDELEPWYAEEARDWMEDRLRGAQTAAIEAEPLPPPTPGWPGGPTGWMDAGMLPVPPVPGAPVPSNTRTGPPSPGARDLALDSFDGGIHQRQSSGEDSQFFNEVTVHTRVGEFAFREIDGATYDECVALSTDETGQTDMVELLRWLTVRSSADGKLADPAQLHRLPYSVRNQILIEVNELYFPT